MKESVLVTGGAGFIGSNLVDRLLEKYNVVAFDNFSTGSERFLHEAKKHSGFRLVRADVLDLDALTAAMQGCSAVFHLQANADVRNGINQPRKDLEQNTQGTFNVLEAMRLTGVKKIAFSSTGSIYGEAAVIPTPEDAPFPIQTSLYGASKLAGEGMIAAYCEGYGFQSWIFRFVGILGERYTHGHVVDFYNKLKANPEELAVLGDGRQRKSYLYVQDCIDAIFLAMEKAGDKVNIFNLGTDDYCEVVDSIAWITKQLGVKPQLKFTGGDRGWIGDNPFIFLDTKKIRSLGWAPALSIEQAILRTVAYLQSSEELLTRV